jgi:hypothetical protein
MEPGMAVSEKAPQPAVHIRFFNYTTSSEDPGVWM